MAKNKTTATAEDKLILDTMPGADPISDSDAAPFEVDLNFDTPEEEVEFPKEDEIEEISETELTTTPEEMEAQAGQQEETTNTSESKTTEEAGLDAESQTNTPELVSADEGEVVEAVVDKAPMVPKSRLDEVLAKQKALQKQLDEKNAVQQQALENSPEYDFSAKELEYQDLILNGESQKAADLRSDIRNAEKEQFMFEVQAKMGQTVRQSTEAMALQAKADELQITFPQLDENSASFNAELTQEVMDLRDAFMVQGFAGADALEKAAKYVVKAPEVASQPTLVPNTQTKVAQEKKKTATVARNLQAADSQPPAMAGEGAGAKTDKKVDLNVLSTEEFDALPAETLRRMRGDFG